MPDLAKITKAELAAELNEAQQERDQLREERDRLQAKAAEAAEAARARLDAEARAIDGCARALQALPSPRHRSTGLHDKDRSPEAAAVARVLRLLANRYRVDHILASADEIEAREQRNRDRPVINIDADQVAESVRQAAREVGGWG